jgi:hypothetical protein
MGTGVLWVWYPSLSDDVTETPRPRGAFFLMPAKEPKIPGQRASDSCVGADELKLPWNVATIEPLPVGCFF